MLTIYSQETIINQVPNSGNGNIAICTARVTLPNGQAFTGMGTSCAAGKDGNHQLALKNAEQEAIQQAIHMAEAHAQMMQAGSMAPPMMPPRSKPGKPSNSRNLITEKQKQLIAAVASRHGCSMDDVEKLSMSLYGKPIAELGTKDVNPILRQIDPSWQ